MCFWEQETQGTRKLYAPRAFTWACDTRSNKKKTNRKKQMKESARISQHN